MPTVNPLGSILTQTATSIGGAKESGKGFSDLLGAAIKSTLNNQKVAENMSLKAANAEDIPMHEVIQAVSKAEMTLNTMITVRDRAIEAYQEIMRMPI